MASQLTLTLGVGALGLLLYLLSKTNTSLGNLINKAWDAYVLQAWDMSDPVKLQELMNKGLQGGGDNRLVGTTPHSSTTAV